MTAFIAIASVLAYVAMTLLVARWRYAATRPYTEPLACEWRYHRSPSDHIESCYRRYGMIDTTGEATAFALLLGLAWPFIWPAMLIRRIVTAGTRELPEETQAQIRRLEAENERLRRQQET